MYRVVSTTTPSESESTACAVIAEGFHDRSAAEMTLAGWLAARCPGATYVEEKGCWLVKESQSA
jgi:hypothetical protein